MRAIFTVLIFSLLSFGCGTAELEAGPWLPAPPYVTALAPDCPYDDDAAELDPYDAWIDRRSCCGAWLPYPMSIETDFTSDASDAPLTP